MRQPCADLEVPECLSLTGSHQTIAGKVSYLLPDFVWFIFSRRSAKNPSRAEMRCRRTRVDVIFTHWSDVRADCDHAEMLAMIYAYDGLSTCLITGGGSRTVVDGYLDLLVALISARRSSRTGWCVTSST